jgi:hypothetical protein
VELLDEGDEEHVLLTGLKHTNSYQVFFCSERTVVLDEETGREAMVLSTDEVIEDGAVDFYTTDKPRMSFDVDWDLMDEPSRRAEVMLANRDLTVINAAKTAVPSVQIPSDHDIKELDGKLSREVTKKWKHFVKWWTHSDALPVDNAAAVRKQFLFREVCYVLAHPDAAMDSAVTAAGILTAEVLQALRDKVCMASLGVAVSENDSVTSGGSKRSRSSAADLNEHLMEYVLELSENANFNSFRTYYCGDAVGSVGAAGMSVEEKDGLEWDLFTKRMKARAGFLVSRVRAVEVGKGLMKKLKELWKNANMDQLSEKDMEQRRGDLSDDEVASIMGLKKFNAFMKMRRIGPARIGTMSLQELSGCDAFIDVPAEDFEPDDPPLAEVPGIPGTNRKPLRLWSLMREQEKMLELEIACQLDPIILAAAMEGVPVPDIEDGNMATSILSQALAPHRTYRWKAFRAWYCADEENEEKKPSKRTPSLHRALFAETFEAPLVLTDAAVINELGASARRPSAEQLSSQKKKKSDSNSVLTDASGAPLPPALTEISPALASYEFKMFGVAGSGMRMKLLTCNRDILLKSRRASMLRSLLPPGPARISRFMMFPKFGVVTGSIDLPPQRYKLFRSRTKQSWTIKEIMDWLPAKVNGKDDPDDILLRKAEARGAKHREYVKWLALEHVRVASNRKTMLEEDCFGRQLRTYIKSMEKKVMKEDGVDDEKLMAEWKTRLAASVVYEGGSGLLNNDEEQDARDEIERQKNAAFNAYLDKKRAAMQHRKFLEEEERDRLARIEVDKRLAANVARRKAVRKNLEQVKISRAALADAKEDAAQRALEAAVVVEATRKEQQRLELAFQNEQARESRSRADMSTHEYLQREQSRVISETQQMEHEDIRSLVLEAQRRFNRQENAVIRDRAKELYQTFEPTPFRKELVFMPHIHSVDALVSESVVEDDDVFASGILGMPSVVDLDVPFFSQSTLFDGGADVAEKPDPNKLETGLGDDFVTKTSGQEFAMLGLPRAIANTLSAKSSLRAKTSSGKAKMHLAPFRSRPKTSDATVKTLTPADDINTLKALNGAYEEYERDAGMLDDQDDDELTTATKAARRRPGTTGTGMGSPVAQGGGAAAAAAAYASTGFGQDWDVGERAQTVGGGGGGRPSDEAYLRRLLEPTKLSRRSETYHGRNEKKAFTSSVADFNKTLDVRKKTKMYVDAAAVVGTNYYFTAYPPDAVNVPVQSFLKLVPPKPKDEAGSIDVEVKAPAPDLDTFVEPDPDEAPDPDAAVGEGEGEETKDVHEQEQEQQVEAAPVTRAQTAEETTRQPSVGAGAERPMAFTQSSRPGSSQEPTPRARTSHSSRVSHAMLSKSLNIGKFSDPPFGRQNKLPDPFFRKTFGLIGAKQTAPVSGVKRRSYEEARTIKMAPKPVVKIPRGVKASGFQEGVAKAVPIPIPIPIPTDINIGPAMSTSLDQIGAGAATTTTIGNPLSLTALLSQELLSQELAVQSCETNLRTSVGNGGEGGALAGMTMSLPVGRLHKKPKSPSPSPTRLPSAGTRRREKVEDERVKNMMAMRRGSTSPFREDSVERISLPSISGFGPETSKALIYVRQQIAPDLDDDSHASFEQMVDLDADVPSSPGAAASATKA